MCDGGAYEPLPDELRRTVSGGREAARSADLIEKGTDEAQGLTIGAKLDLTC